MNYFYTNHTTLSIEKAMEALEIAQQSLEQASSYEGKRIMFCHDTQYGDKTFFAGDFVGISENNCVFSPIFNGYRFDVNQNGVTMISFEALFEKSDCFLGYLPNDLPMAESIQDCFKHAIKHFLTISEKPMEKAINLEA